MKDSSSNLRDETKPDTRLIARMTQERKSRREKKSGAAAQQLVLLRDVEIVSAEKIPSPNSLAEEEGDD
uniref:IBB domain-containing protein n=1 Tax=Ascaris lumbricoides TaxID=6252 RepID=A0A0M3HZB3_ASCLU